MDIPRQADDLALFEAENTPGGLFIRYARGRIRHFVNRQILGLLGAMVVGLVLSVPVGLAIAALILAGEMVDCAILSRLVPKVQRNGLQPPLKWAAAISGGMQISCLILALWLCHATSQTPEMTFFIAAFLTGVTINAGLVRPYFRLGTDIKLGLAALAVLILVLREVLDPSEMEGRTFLFLAAVVMLALTSMMFVRQSERAFDKQQSLERSMAERNADLRRSRSDLARSGQFNQRLALAARHANDAIVFLDADHCYAWVNEAFTRITGFTPEQALGRRPGDLLNAAETSPETLEKLAIARRDNAEIRVEIFNRDQNGRGYWVDTSIIPIRDDAGNLVVSLAIEREITEAKQREADLARAREDADAAVQAKSRFLANMSHEIRTPMNGVIGVAELLSETRLTKTQRDYVDTVLESARALLRIINDILDLSKLQSGTSAPEMLPFDLRNTVDSVLRLLRPSAGSKGIHLALRLDPDLPAGWHLVAGDQGKLRQILVNLVGNALKFTPEGEVAVHIGRGPAGLVFRVTDTGIGIAPDRLQTIFDSFTQADDSISRRFGGTGLGLTISAMLAKAMGGEIKVESTVGKGSCFALCLPLKAAAAPLSIGPQASLAAPQPTGIRVLVAEDNRTNMMILRKVLAGQVAELIEAPDGACALRAWQDEAPDMILMDVSMPVMDGLTAVREIRSQEQALGRRRCPILALTASSQWEDQNACRAAGFDGYLVKPFRRDVLLQAIADHARAGDPSALPRSA